MEGGNRVGRGRLRPRSGFIFFALCCCRPDELVFLMFSTNIAWNRFVYFEVGNFAVQCSSNNEVKFELPFQDVWIQVSTTDFGLITRHGFPASTLIITMPSNARTALLKSEPQPTMSISCASTYSTGFFHQSSDDVRIYNPSQNSSSEHWPYAPAPILAVSGAGFEE